MHGVAASSNQLSVPPYSRRVFSLPSRSSINIPISELLVNGSLDIYPYIGERGLLFIQIHRNSLTLSAGPYIGLIPLNPTVVVDVQPKLPVGNFAHVLDTAQRSLSSVHGSTRLYKENELTPGSVLEFVAANLADALKPIQTNGLLKQYVEITELTSSPRGRIDLTATMLRSWTRGEYHKIQAQRFEQSADIAANRVLKSALASALLRMAGSSREIRKEVNRAYSELPDSIGELRHSDIYVVKRMLDSRALPESRMYYIRPLTIALMMLSSHGISLQQYGSDISLESFIVNFETTFEDYIRNAIEYWSDPSVVQVEDGNGLARKPLFDDRIDPPAQPDIVVSSVATGKKVIAEVKYKVRPNRDDYNQAITYALSYRANRVILVHQNRQGDPNGLRRIGTIGSIVLDAYAFDLAGADLQQEEKLLAECIVSATD